MIPVACLYNDQLNNTRGLFPRTFLYFKAFFKYLAFIVFFIGLNSVSGQYSIDYDFKDAGIFQIEPICQISSSENLINSTFTDFDSLNIPLKRAGRLFLIEAKIDGQIGNLIFDTGACDLLLNRTYFKDYRKIGTQDSRGITGNVDAVEKILIENLRFFDMEFKELKVDISNLSHLENRAGVKILGLIGFNLIKNFEIVIDGNNNLLQLFKVDKNGDRVKTKNSLKPDCIQKIDFFNNVLFLTAKIKEKKLRFCFDTGAEINSISSFCPKKVLSGIKIKGRTMLRGAGTKEFEVIHGIIENFEFESNQIENMQTIIVDLEPLNLVYGIDIDGVLGYNFLSQGIISINFVKKEFGISFIKQN